MRTRWGVLALLCALAYAPAALASPVTPALQKECAAARGKRPATAVNPLAIRVSKSSEPIRSVVVRRFVRCGYVGNKLDRVEENIYLQLATQDRGEVQFDTKNPTQTKDYYVECEAGLPSVKPGTTGALSLSCVHRIHRKDGGEADRVTGVHSFKSQPGTFEVKAAKGGALTFVFDDSVENQFEKLRLQGEATGAVSTSVQVFNCAPPKPGTRPLRPDVCR